jgi:aspartate/methionine/tyrosine aminotransferase
VTNLALVAMGNVVVPVGIAQEGVAVALELGDADVAAATATWEARRDALLAELEGLPAVRAAGGWSLLLDGTELGMTGAEMSERLLREAWVAATPMAGWGVTNGAQHLRFVFANESVERLTGVGPRIRRALGS